MRKSEEKILVVDDDPFARKLLSKQLKSEGFHNIGFAETGRSALDVLDKEAVDLVLLDLEMPGMTGVEVLQEIKGNLRHNDLPVIMISGVDDVESIAHCIELGAEDYLHKPFNPTMLRARLQNALEKRRVRQLEKNQRLALQNEKRRSDELLEVILPRRIACELRESGSVQTRYHENVSILFCDIVGFTAYCSEQLAEDVVKQLQFLFERFEEIVQQNGLTKIKTIGDAFMAEGGVIVPNADPVSSAIRCGLDMIAEAKRLCPDWDLRVGVACGPVVAGIIGTQRFQFDLWGDTVNVAARMSDVGQPGTVTLPHYCVLQATDTFEGRLLGEVAVKGKGAVRVVECRHPASFGAAKQDSLHDVAQAS